MMLPPRAYTFIFLNSVRVLSIIALLLVFASNVVTLVHDVKAVNRFMALGKVPVSGSGSNSTFVDDSFEADYIADSTVPNQAAGVFWAVLNRLLIIFQTIVLILSELGWPSAFFNRFFPVLGKDFGLGALGVIQCLIGAAILSHFVDSFTLVSAFFLFSLGCLNILLGLIFRESAKIKRSLTSWKDHAKSALPTHVAGVDVRGAVDIATKAPGFVSSYFPGKHDENEKENKTGPKNGLGFGRHADKAAALKGYLISRPVESLPRYAPSKLG